MTSQKLVPRFAQKRKKAIVWYETVGTQVKGVVFFTPITVSVGVHLGRQIAASTRAVN